MNPKTVESVVIATMRIKSFYSRFWLEQGVKNQRLNFVLWLACRFINFRCKFCAFFVDCAFLRLAIEDFLMHFSTRKTMHEMGIGKMRFRCIIKQFTYLNSFWYSLCPFYRLPFLFDRLISFNFEVLLLLFLRLFLSECEREIQKRYKNSSVFLLNSIKLFVFFWFFGTSCGFRFSRAFKSFSRFS